MNLIDEGWELVGDALPDGGQPINLLSGDASNDNNRSKRGELHSEGKS